MNKLLLSEPTKKYLKLVSWIALFLLISYSTSMITKSSINTWYVTLNRSFLTPPGYVFGLVWSILYIMIATLPYSIIVILYSLYFYDYLHKIIYELTHKIELNNINNTINIIKDVSGNE